MRILNWNIAGGKPVDAIIAHLQAEDADIVVLAEYRHDTPQGAKLLKQLSSLGYSEQFCSRHDNQNGVLIAARCTASPWIWPPAESEPLIVGAQFTGFRLLGLFLNDAAAVERCFALLEEDAHLCSTPTILTGDFNYGPTSNAPDRYTLIKNLTKRGWTDLWRHHYGNDITATCWTHRNRAFWNRPGSGYSMVDHFLISPHLLNSVTEPPKINHTVMQEFRESKGCSDHASVTVDV